MRKVNMMVQRLVVLLLMMVVFVGCGDDESVEDLKDTDAKNIILGMVGVPTSSVGALFPCLCSPSDSFESGD